MRATARSPFLVVLLLWLAACAGSNAPVDAAAPDAAPRDAAIPDAPDDADPDVEPPPPEPPPPEVTIAQGTVRGRRVAGSQEFLGIPYAAPPVGPLRWQPPRPAAAWTGVRDATAQPARCPQSLIGSVQGSEDCLFVNVHTPDPRPARAPVMVWIHGGAFTLGEGLQFDRGTRGDVLASQRGVVVVSMNYRLGALGFLAHARLTAEGGGRSGNYGLLDQRAALQWVRQNIASFGGDPDEVTVFGESAGGASVCAHLSSPMSAGLFHRAIVQSGPCGGLRVTLAQGEAQGARFAQALGCDGGADALACMRAAGVDRVMAALPAPPTVISSDPAYGRWVPIVDGAFITADASARVQAGSFNRVPVMYGWNRDEGTLFVMLANQTGLTASQYPAVVRELLGGDAAVADRVLARYPLGAYPTPWQAYAAVMGDFVIRCPAHRVLRAMAPHLPRAYAYEFTYARASFQLTPPVDLGAFHSAEVQYVFGHPAAIGRSRFMGDDLALHQLLMGYWTRFARGSDPNGEGAPAWPRYTSEGEAHLGLDVRPVAGARAGSEVCAFWETLGVFPP